MSYSEYNLSAGTSNVQYMECESEQVDLLTQSEAWNFRSRKGTVERFRNGTDDRFNTQSDTEI